MGPIAIPMGRAERRAAEMAARRAGMARHYSDAGLMAFDSALARSSTAPLGAGQLRDLGLAYHGALAALTQGNGTWDDCNTLALASNVALLLCEYGLGGDELEAVKAAQDAVVRLVLRGKPSGRYVLTGAELRDLQALLALHDAQLAHEECTRRVVIEVLRRIRNRIAEGHTMGAV